jgi:adhesin transport system membrane fusion protein
LVKEGDMVEKGQVLLRIDDTRFASSYRESEVQALALQAKVARLQAEVAGQALPLASSVPSTSSGSGLPAGAAEFAASERELYQSRQEELEAAEAVLKEQRRQREQELDELRAKLGQLQRSHDLAAKELNITAPLVKQGVMSEVELLRLQRQVNDLRGQLESCRLSIPRGESALSEIQRKISELHISFRAAAMAQLNEAKAELSRLAESNPALQDRVRRAVVRSPVKGTVKRLKVNTVGGVVQPGMDLVEIVPSEDSLLIEARIRPSDIAFLHPGQAATVKFSAYDYAIYGGLPARLEHISADTLIGEQGEAFFLIRLRADRAYLGSADQPLPIIPGMTAGVDILTGTKTVLTYLLKPLRRVREQALRER